MLKKVEQHDTMHLQSSSNIYFERRTKMTKKKKKQPPELKVYKESFGESTITIREREPDTGRWIVTDFEKMDLSKLSKALFKLLRDKKECYVIYISGVKLNRSYTKEEIFQELANSICEEKVQEIFLN